MQDEAKKVNISYHWPFTRSLIKEIEKTEYDEMNNHLPKVHTVEDYYKQIFYCVINNDVSGLRSLINKLEELDINLSTILYRVRTATSGDNLLAYAVRHGKLDVVRFLLSISATSNIPNYKNETPLNIAVKNGQVDIVRTILTMQ